ncbi:hypothetical protein [Leptospira levettii]|uniref:hypothetical protein n=1 Tax=Leptospira levettii TaxID=2023178 RepID=UPI000C2A6714|nr:hypothetical protein [Leptospira levettii]PJZ87610.1 hypothetical protein CH368_15995 [Leptospira levettii]
MKSFKNDYLREQEFKDFIDQSLQNAIDNMDLSGRSTDELPEGATNRYFTEERARNAVIEDTIVDGVLDRSPSQNAVYDALVTREPSLPGGGLVGQFLNHLKAWAYVTWGAIAGKPSALESSNWTANGDKLLAVNPGGTDLVLINPPSSIGLNAPPTRIVWTLDLLGTYDPSKKIFTDFNTLYSDFALTPNTVERVIYVRSGNVTISGTFDFKNAIFIGEQTDIGRHTVVVFYDAFPTVGGCFFRKLENIHISFYWTTGAGGFRMSPGLENGPVRYLTMRNCVYSGEGSGYPQCLVGVTSDDVAAYIYLEDVTNDFYRPGGGVPNGSAPFIGVISGTAPIVVSLNNTQIRETVFQNISNISFRYYDFFSLVSPNGYSPRNFSVATDISSQHLGRVSGSDTRPIQITLPETRLNLGSNIVQLAAGSETLNCLKNSHFRKLGGTATIGFSNMAEGQRVVLLMDSIGSAYAITWTGSIRWAGATLPTPTATASRYDIYEFIRLGGITFGSASLNHGTAV